MRKARDVALTSVNSFGGEAPPDPPLARSRPTWAQAEGSPLPLGVSWIHKEQAFNFAVHAEGAESVTLLLYSARDLANPLLTYSFDFLRNKSGRVWHCRIPMNKLGEARYYAYSVSGQRVSQIDSFDPQKVLLDPYAKCIFFPPGFSRELATREGSNAGRAPLGVLTGHRDQFDWTGDRSPHHDSEAIIYELHVKGFTKHPSSGIHPSRAGTYAGLVEKLPYLKDLGITVVELMPIFQRDPQEGDYWGYMPLNFFAPHAQYGSTCDDNEQHLEFKSMVRAFTKLELPWSSTSSTTTPARVINADRSTASRVSMPPATTCVPADPIALMPITRAPAIP